MRDPHHGENLTKGRDPETREMISLKTNFKIL